MALDTTENKEDWRKYSYRDTGQILRRSRNTVEKTGSEHVRLRE